MISRTMPTRNGGYIGLYSLEEVRNMMTIPEILILQIESVGDGYFLVEQRDCRKNKLVAVSTIEDKMDELQTRFRKHACSHPDSDTDYDVDFANNDSMGCLNNFIYLLKKELNK